MSATRPQFPAGEYSVQATRVSLERPRGGKFAGQWSLQVQFTVRGRGERASFQLPWQPAWQPFTAAFSVLTGMTFQEFAAQDLPATFKERLPALAQLIVGHEYRADVRARVDARGREWVNVHALIARIDPDPMAAHVNTLRELLQMDKATLRAMVEEEMGVSSWDALDQQGRLILRDLLIDQVHRLPPEQFAAPEDDTDEQTALAVELPE